MTLSVTMSGVDYCSGACTYCSAASSMNYSQPSIYLEQEKMIPFLTHLNEKIYQGFNRDWEKLATTLTNDAGIREEMHKAVKENRKPQIHIDIWGGNPLTCFDAFKETVLFLEQYFQNWKLDLGTSDNGLGIWNDEIYNFIKEHRIGLQISHDGIGEWLRLPFDPLYTEPYSKYWNKLLEDKLFTAVNCTLSFYNSSFWKNIGYWNNWLHGRPFNYIKLNHCYNSDYDIKTINKEGRWQDTIIEELQGKPIGNWNLHNGSNPWDSHVLDDYFQEYLHLAMLYTDPLQTNRPDLAPFKSYIMEQMSRYRFIPDHDTKNGMCRAYQRYKHSIGDSKGYDTRTFVISTTGSYCECNLLDERYEVENPGGVQPDYCTGCKYEFSTECNTCGSKKFPSKCDYLYRFMQFTETVNRINGMIAGIKENIRRKI